MARSACAACGGAIPRQQAGRPRVYCSSVCRRSAEYELRRVQSRLAEAEKREMRERARRVGSYYAGSGPSPDLVFWAGEVERLTARLRSLLSGQPDDAAQDSAAITEPTTRSDR